jgi:uncharacterized OsmC-like protein
MSQIAGEFDLSVEQIDGFEFRVRFDKEQYPELHMDEPPPLGRDVAPNPARVLAAAIGNCLCASFVFCARRSKAEVRGIRADVHVTMTRNEQKRLRIGRVDVHMRPRMHEGREGPDALASCLSVFEDFCTVTQSVRAGIDVHVAVTPE